MPGKPAELRVDTEPGSLDVEADWDDVADASHYLVRWRVGSPGNQLNEGIEVQSSDADITVESYGEWVLRVQACNSAGCGAPLARRFAVEAAPEPTAAPTPEPTACPDAGADSSADARADADPDAGTDTSTHTGADSRANAGTNGGAHPGADSHADAGTDSHTNA